MITVVISSDNHCNVPRRSEEARRIMEFIRDDGAVRGVDLYGFAGDIVDGPMTEKDRLWLFKYIQSCANIAPCVLGYGNHDPRYSLDFLAHLKAKYPIIVESAAGVHVVETRSGKIAVAVVAFPWKAEILARVGVASSEQSDEIAQHALADVFRGLGVQVRALGLPTVALVHGTMRGSKISPDQPDRPLGMEIPREDLAMIGADFYAVGHIHLANEWQQGNAWIATPTCGFFSDYGESNHKKGYILVTFNEVFEKAEERMDQGLYPLEVKWERISTPAIPMLLFEGKYVNGGMNWLSDIPLCLEDASGCDIRLRYHYKNEFSDAAKHAASEIQQDLLSAGAVNVTLDPKLIPTTRSGIPGLAQAGRIEDKLRLYWNSVGNVPSDSIATQLIESLHEIQSEVAEAGYSMGGAGRTAPSLKKVRWKGFLKFPEENEIDFSALEELVTIVAPNECLSGDTLVDVPRDMRAQPDGILIRDLVGTTPLVYSYDGERLVVTRAQNVRKTGINRDVYRVIFTAEPRRRKRGLLPPMEIKATGDHEFMLRDGSYRRVRDLLPGDSLMPLYRNKEGAYLQVHRNDGTLEDEHRMVGAFLKGRPLLRSEHAHHDNQNTWDNSERNIKVLTASEHSALHGALHPPTYIEHPRGMLGKKHTEASRLRISQSVQRLLSDGTLQKRMSEGQQVRQRRRTDPQCNADLMADLYVTRKMSTIAIGKRLGLSATCVNHWLRKHDIPRRTISESRRENHKVLAIVYAGVDDVYDLEVPRYHNFVANGVVVHNCGKTLALQLMSAGVNYGRTPTRGTLDDLSIAKDSFIEVTQQIGGTEYVLSQMCNGVTRSGMVSLTKNGVAELSKAGRAEYKVWADKNLIPQNLYDAVICQSGTESVIDLKDGPRVELLLRVLGLEIYEMWAEDARKRAKVIGEQLSEIRARLGELSRGQTVEFCKEWVARTGSEKRHADETLRWGQATVTDLRDKNAAAQRADVEYRALMRQRQDVLAERQRIEDELTSLVSRIRINKVILAEADDIAQAVKDVASYSESITALQEQSADLRVTQSEVNGELRASRNREESLQEKLKALRRAITNADAVLERSIAIRDAIYSVTEYEKEVARLKYEGQSLWQEIENRREVVSKGSETRIGGLRAALVSIADDDPSKRVAIIVAKGAISDDDALILQVAVLPTEIEALQEQWQRTGQAQRNAETTREAYRQMAVRLPEIEAAEKSKVEAEALIDNVSRSITEEGKTILLLNERVVAVVKDLASKTATIVAAQREVTRLAPLAAKDATLKIARTQIQGYEEQASTLRERLTKIVVPSIPAPPSIIDLSEYEAALNSTSRIAQEAQTQLTLAEKALEDAEGSEQRQRELAAQASVLEQRQAVETRLGIELGKDGLQKAEIASAGPDLTAITNELLQRAGDTRHSVSIATERTHSNKKDTIPCLDIMVFDSVEGIHKESRRLSDAGKIIVGWPFSLALIIIGCERAGITEGPTIFIDEALGPADEENAPRCVAMLRHFAKRLGSQVIFVAQQASAWALADNRIHLEQGRVRID